MSIIIKDVLAVTMNDQGEIGRYTILIDGARIADMIRSPSRDISYEGKQSTVIDGKNKIALPGFVNGHIHSDMTLSRGLGDGLTLYEQDNDSWISERQWFHNELTGDARYYGKLLQYVEAVKGGTTFLCDVPFWFTADDLVKPFEEVGLSGAVVLDYRDNFLTGEHMEEAAYRAVASSLRQNGILPVVEGPSEENFRKDLLLMLHDRAVSLDTCLQMHLAETTWRLDLVRSRHGTSSVRYLHEIGFLDHRAIGSHGVYIDTGEIDILKDTGAKIVNCPAAEMKIADGIAPVSDFMRTGVPVGIGTDGALWNDSADMFAEMKHLMLVQRVAHGASAIDAYSCLYAATKGGASVFGIENELGSLEKGKRAHITLLDYRKPHLVPLYHGSNSNVLENIVSCAKASDVDTVIVDGRIIVQNGILRTLDESALVDECQKIGKHLFENLS
jgi:5-methylthioadenosine/S-adenosylhomocysteine deaminase